MVDMCWYFLICPLRFRAGGIRRVGGTATSPCDTLYIRHIRWWYLRVSRGAHCSWCNRAVGLTLGSLQVRLKTTLAARLLTFSSRTLSFCRWGSQTLHGAILHAWTCKGAVGSLSHRSGAMLQVSRCEMECGIRFCRHFTDLFVPG